MPHDNGRDTAPRRAIIAVDVATADAAGSHAHQDFTGTRRRFRKIGNLKMLVFGKQKNFHAPGTHRDGVAKTVHTLTHILRFWNNQKSFSWYSQPESVQCSTLIVL